MIELKSVRVRRINDRLSTFDIKVSIYDDVNSYVLYGYNMNEQVIWDRVNYQKGRYEKYNIDGIINFFIELNEKLDRTHSTYKIIQNPWENNPPIYRNFGFDPYYLNNGSEFHVEWYDVNGAKISGIEYSDKEGNEIPLDTVNKTIFIHHNNKMYGLNDLGEFEDKELIKSDFVFKNILDTSVISDVIGRWGDKNIELCSPANEYCNLIDFFSPISSENITEEETTTEEEIKTDLIIEVDDKKVVSGKDITISVYLGSDANTDSFVYMDHNTEGLSAEFIEGDFMGLDEQEYILQEEIADAQMDSDSNLVESYIEPPVSISSSRFDSLDSLLRVAGDCARECGKNPRVKYSNLRTGYVKGIHGLCPQGTLSVAYALTGVKALGMMRGNANFFAMNGSNNLSTTGVYNAKTKVGMDYINNPSKWQVGDILANDYTGKPYGHIQIWTGWKWVSDFTQNRIQIRNIDTNTIALWRLNATGIAKINDRKASIV